MLTSKLHITYGMMWSLIFANIIAAVLLLTWANQLQRIIFIPAHLVVPGITLFVLMGAWTAGNNIGDWITILIFAVIGIAMKQAGWPRPPLVLGYILGRIMENSLHLSMAAYGMTWFYRPICIVIAIAIVITVFYAVRSHRRRNVGPETIVVSDSDGGNTRLSLGFGIVVFLVLAYAIATSFNWPAPVRLFPLAFSIPAIVLAAFAALYDWRGLKAMPAAPAGPGDISILGIGSVSSEFLRGCHFFIWLVAILVVTILLGQHVALPLFIALYLVVWGRYRWPLALAYAAAGLAVLVGLFDYLSPTVWYPALLLR
jgi:hypothetical protein